MVDVDEETEALLLMGMDTQKRFYRADWDSEVGAVYLYLVKREEWPKEIHQFDLHGGGGMILDVALEGGQVLGIEMLTTPIGIEGTPLTTQEWVMAARAWEMTKHQRAGRLNGFLLFTQDGSDG